MDKLVNNIYCGAFGGLISRFFVQKIFKNKKEKKYIANIASVVIILIVVGVTNSLILPKINRYKLQNEFDRTLSNMKETKIFYFIKKHDPEEYKKVLEKMFEITQKNKDPNKIYTLSSNYGGIVFQKYLRETSPSLLREYVKNYISVIKEFKRINIDIAASYVFPNVFGAPSNPNVIFEVVNNSKSTIILEKIIIESTKKEKNYKIRKSSILLELYRSDYSKKYPKHFKFLSNPKLVRTKKDKIVLIDSLLLFYKNILLFPKSKSEQILGAIFQN